MNEYSIDKKINGFAPLGTASDWGKSMNGGKGSGNFGHSGRPGEIGGSAPSGAGGLSKTEGKESGLTEEETKELTNLILDPKGNYGPSGGFELLNGVKEYIRSRAGGRETGLDEAIAEAYEDEARRKLGLPTMEEESDGEGDELAYSDYSDIADEIENIVEHKNLPDLVHDLGIAEIATVIELVQDKSAKQYAGRMADSPTEWGQAEGLKKFAEDMGLHGEYGLSKDATEGDLRTKWREAERELDDRIRFVEENAFSRKILNGGAGSGNFGHAGRPGERGGSAPQGAPGISVLAGKKPGLELYKAIGESNERVAEQERAMERIAHILGKKVKEDSVTSDTFSSYVSFEDGGKRYSYEKSSDTLREVSDDPMSRGKEILSPEEKKAQADDWFTGEKLKGSDIKKRLKSYGLNVDGISISRDSGGYSDAWHITGSGAKHDLKTIEKIVKRKLEHYDVDERTGEILSGGNTFVFVRDTDNSLYKELTDKINHLEKILNGGKGSGNFGHAGRPGEVGGSAGGGSGASREGSEDDFISKHEGKKAYYSPSSESGYKTLAKGDSGFRNVEELAHGALTLFSRLEENEVLYVAGTTDVLDKMKGVAQKTLSRMGDTKDAKAALSLKSSIDDARQALYSLSDEVTRLAQSNYNYSRRDLTDCDATYEEVQTHLAKAEKKLSKLGSSDPAIDEYRKEVIYQTEAIGKMAKKVHDLVNELPDRAPHDIIVQDPSRKGSSSKE